MATSQQVIKTLRDAGIPEDIIAKKVKELGGTYSSPVQTSSMGISGPEDLIAKTNLPKPSGGISENPIVKFLFNAPARLGKGIGTLAGNLANPIGYIKDPETLRLQQQADEMATLAEQSGDVEGARRLREASGQSRAVNEQIQTERGESYKTAGEDILKGGVGTAAYLLPAGKLIPSIAGGAMTGFGASERGEELSSTLTGGTIGTVLPLAGKALSWTGKQFTQKAIQASGASENAIIKKFGQKVNDLASKYGKNVDDLLGPISEKNRGGSFKVKLREAEDIIQQTVNEAGSNIKIDGKIVTNALKKELNLHKTGLDDEVISGLTAIIKQAQSKYKNGLTAKQALNILRIANSKYGKAMATTPTGSTAKVAQMTIAETMRDTLKQMFPELKEALNTQSEILTLRPIVEKARGSVISKAGQGLFPKGFDVTKPLTYPVVGPTLEAVGEKILPLSLKGAGMALESPITQRGLTSTLVSPTEPTPTEAPMETSLETGGLSTPENVLPKEEPILSPGGQWQWDATQNDWIPYQAKTTQGESLTGYTPEELYQGALSAYQAGDKSSYSQLMKMYGDETKYRKTAGGKKATMTAGQKKELSDFEVSVKQLNSLNTSIDQFKDIMGPVGGRLRTLNPYDTDTQAFNSKMTAVAQIVGKAMEGGVLRKEDTIKYARMLPQISDTPEVAKRKIQNVMEMVKLQKQTKEELYSGSENMGDVYTEPVITEEE
jgi:hypothetical protein